MSSNMTSMAMPTDADRLLPPFICLAVIILALLMSVIFDRWQTRKRNILRINSDNVTVLATKASDPHGNGYPGNKISPNKPMKDFMPSIYEQRDLDLIIELQGRGRIRYKEPLRILMPVAASLLACPIFLFLHPPMTEFFWPTHTMAPNINDAIACFLVPAGMVYAICFGFAFQQVMVVFVETQIAVTKQAKQLDKLLGLVNDLTCVPIATRVAMLRSFKDVTFTCLASITGYQEDVLMNAAGQGLNAILRTLCNSKKQATDLLDKDLWQNTVFTRLETVLTEDEVFAPPPAFHMSTLQWVFLETLGFFSFLGVLLTDVSSYRLALAMCIITVFSITFLCYIVADIDSPFHGFFRVDLDAFRRLITQLDDAFVQSTSEIPMNVGNSPGKVK